MIAIEGEVLFDSGKVKLRSGAKGVLQKVRDVVGNQYVDKDILIFGHTDDQPIKKSGWEDNYQLSSERALAVVRWMKENGITPNRLVACGAGEFRPRVPNSNAKNRQQNRRVEIFALDAETRTASK
jgi:chemotaxis protein MotB